MSTSRYFQTQINNNKANDEGIVESFGRKEQKLRADDRKAAIVEEARVVNPNAVAKRFKNLSWLSTRGS